MELWLTSLRALGSHRLTWTNSGQLDTDNVSRCVCPPRTSSGRRWWKKTKEVGQYVRREILDFHVHFSAKMIADRFQIRSRLQPGCFQCSSLLLAEKLVSDGLNRVGAVSLLCVRVSGLPINMDGNFIWYPLIFHSKLSSTGQPKSPA